MYCKQTTIEMSLYGCSPEEHEVHAMIPLDFPAYLSHPWCDITLQIRGLYLCAAIS